MEADTGVISLEEGELVVEALLSELYGLKTSIFGSIFSGFALKPEAENSEIVTTLVRVFIAADKVTPYHSEVVSSLANNIQVRFARVQD